MRTYVVKDIEINGKKEKATTIFIGTDYFEALDKMIDHFRPGHSVYRNCLMFEIQEDGKILFEYGDDWDCLLLQEIDEFTVDELDADIQKYIRKKMKSKGERR